MNQIKYKKIVVKVGTNVITKDNGLLDIPMMKKIIIQLVKLKKLGVEVILVSSGAMGAGKSVVKLDKKTDEVGRRQVLASVGQVELMNVYKRILSKHKFISAQILSTKEDFRDRNHYMNMRNCFSSLSKDNIIPIVNENDVVSITELMFTDNDELAGLISAMMNVDALFLLTNVDGVYDGNPEDKTSRIIHTIEPSAPRRQFATPQISKFGRGGMMTKSKIARKLSNLGIITHIVNGKKNGVILDLFAGDEIGTTFLSIKKISNVKKRLAHAYGQEKGTAYLNELATNIFSNPDRPLSLLPVGVTKITGKFEKGDIIKIIGSRQEEIGLGIAQYGFDTAHSLIGQKGHRALIHYDYLFLNL
ncbi:MAG: glutamate 5-kinase [Candidatus Magasanikbacteria bacterium CG_4_10_14_0_2_um_filter_37_12]|uniref:Glutamate 5-kinase n=1 Tax=Candidatus Magasanikbacteria bacterium CG_4_10_14_0_2_um_filter_37_12 TaxID=1974637 RepID=A0A2M7V6C3_9BACT|nr:MAG: glutamate 5-kinase [Candidatus Magasanikbacteria bacterium CG_4_10_14_0_2_um_filter_37_12]